jgi:hypothetical protein
MRRGHSLLLLAQHKRDEDLLQLLVDEVDAELLKRVLLEDLEAVAVGYRVSAVSGATARSAHMSRMPIMFVTAPRGAIDVLMRATSQSNMLL